MAARHSGLGKGLGDLFAKTDDEGDVALSDGSVFLEIPVDQVQPNPQQPRTVFDEDELGELAESIAEFGVLQPVVVRRAGRDAFELIMGERRLRASKIAGRATIPAIVRGTDDTALLRDALLENLHRANLNPLEEAHAYQQLLEDFACTKEELSQRIHRSRPQISNTLRLLNLPARVQSKVAAGVLSAGHARALLGLDDPELQEHLAERIVAEGLSVRSTEEIVAMGRGTGVRRSASRAPRTPSDREREIAGHLSDHFDTRVKVNIGRNKGKITIEFASGDDLERIMAILDGKTL
ncbi:ParB/RepB/Spo0J family partition protein [Tessaracoccus flavus]|uniref:Chromosome partitioning protein ParB n=1 Tax=Tessaracoccus flavus TaxID=1610493 RepID=A0A1Q2CHX7_9ACTN|nr:ParB/RepB/Spo0J family partition protein [Tessaracoccus flavus]AQP45711.1 chromosome partitioning protein ParB [Tessaracoccus flavus]SDZ13140.1 chromosome partitioning protein, ParB family [Tessaracoccus flavus]